MRGPEPGSSWTPRQRELMHAATHLFAQRGYHSVGITDISGALGLTGPAFYRHYPSKESLLIAVLDEAISGQVEQVRELASGINGPRETLDAIVAHHVEFALDRTETIMIWRTEFRMIPEHDQLRLRYLHRLYTDEWVRTLRRLRPELGAEPVRVMCHAAMALVQSPADYHGTLDRTEARSILITMATDALLGVPSGTPSRTAGARAGRP